MTHPTELFGREQAEEALRDAWRGPARLITLVGAPGVGKTTLWAAQASALGASALRVRLAELAEPDALLDHLWRAARGADSPGAEARSAARLAEELAQRGITTLALDNMEHLLPDAAPRLAELLAAAPGLRLLVTSRERVGLPEERLIELEPLPLASSASPADIAASPAARLFMARAQAVAPGLVWDDRAWGHVHAICRALDGLPLALELAAARLRLLSLEQLAQRLEEQPLTSSIASLERSLAASWELLTPTQQDALALLSCCPDGFEVEAAEALLDPLEPGQGLELLQALRDRSLLSRPEPRLHVYRFVRDFTLARLTPARLVAVRDTHAAHFAALAASQLERFERRGDLAPLRLVSAERANLRAALDHLLGALDAPETSAEAIQRCWLLAGALTMELVRQGSPEQRTLLNQRLMRLIDEARALGQAPIVALVHIGSAHKDARDLARAQRLCDAALLQHPEDARAIWLDAVLRMERRELETARARAQEAMTLADRAGWMCWSARIHVLLGNIAYWAADMEEARERYQRAAELMHTLGAECFEAIAYSNMCFIAAITGEREAAQRFGQRALALFEAHADLRGVGTTHGYLAMSCMNWDELDEALEHLARAADYQARTGQLLLASFSRLNRAQVLQLMDPGADIEPLLAAEERAVAAPQLALLLSHNAGLRAAQLEARGDWASALGLLREALRTHGAQAGDDYKMLHNTRCALLALKLGDKAQALDHLRAAQEAGKRVKHPHYQRIAKLCDAAFADETSWPEHARLLARTLATPIAGAPAGERGEPLYHSSLIIRGVVRQLWPLLTEAQREEVCALAHDPGEQRLVVTERCERFRPPGGPWTSIAHRPALVRLLAMLREARRRGEALGEEAIMEGMWPGERIMPEAATNRIHNAITLLRKAGLQRQLVRVDAGYLLDPEVQLVTLEPWWPRR